MRPRLGSDARTRSGDGSRSQRGAVAPRPEPTGSGRADPGCERPGRIGRPRVLSTARPGPWHHRRLRRRSRARSPSIADTLAPGQADRASHRAARRLGHRSGRSADLVADGAARAMALLTGDGSSGLHEPADVDIVRRVAATPDALQHLAAAASLDPDELERRAIAWRLGGRTALWIHDERWEPEAGALERRPGRVGFGPTVDQHPHLGAGAAAARPGAPVVAFRQRRPVGLDRNRRPLRRSARRTRLTHSTDALTPTSRGGGSRVFPTVPFTSLAAVEAAVHEDRDRDGLSSWPKQLERVRMAPGGQPGAEVRGHVGRAFRR